MQMVLPFCLMASQGQAGEVDFQVNVGLGQADSKWGAASRQGGCGFTAPTAAVELGLVLGTLPRQRVRALFSAVGGEMRNIQISGDYQWTPWRHNSLEAYAFLGPSLNNVSGTYAIREGYVPPMGDGLYRDVNQSWVPGLKVGAGFSWTRHIAVEVNYHLIKMDTAGDQGVPDSTTRYVTVMASFRFSAN